MGPRRGARKIHRESVESIFVIYGFNGAAPGGAENLCRSGFRSRHFASLQWGRAGGRGKSHRPKYKYQSR